MASKRAQRRKKCGHKHRHASQEEAASHIRSLRLRGDSNPLQSYRCEHCGQWHVGHYCSERIFGRRKG